MIKLVMDVIKIIASWQKYFINFIRIAIFIVMAWIGGLKAFQYEADGIVPFVTNSPFMSFFYNNTGKTAVDEKGNTVAEYTLHKNPEGKTGQKNVDWHCHYRSADPARYMVAKDRIGRRIAYIRYVDSYAVVPHHHTRGLCAQSGRRLPDTAIWLPLSVGSGASGAQRHHNDGRRVDSCLRRSTAYPENEIKSIFHS